MSVSILFIVTASSQRKSIPSHVCCPCRNQSGFFVICNYAGSDRERPLFDIVDLLGYINTPKHSLPQLDNLDFDISKKYILYLANLGDQADLLIAQNFRFQNLLQTRNSLHQRPIGRMGGGGNHVSERRNVGYKQECSLSSVPLGRGRQDAVGRCAVR